MECWNVTKKISDNRFFLLQLAPLLQHHCTHLFYLAPAILYYYTIQYIVYPVYCTIFMYNVHCILYHFTLQHTLCTVPNYCPLHTVCVTLYCTTLLYNVQCTLHHAHCCYSTLYQNSSQYQCSFAALQCPYCTLMQSASEL